MSRHRNIRHSLQSEISHEGRQLALPTHDEEQDLDVAELLRPYQQRMDRISGVTPKAAQMLASDLGIEDRVGMLCVKMCLSNNCIEKLQRHIAPAQRTLAFHAIAKRLEEAPPELFTAEIRNDNKPKDTNKHADAGEIKGDVLRPPRRRRRGHASATSSDSADEPLVWDAPTLGLLPKKGSRRKKDRYRRQKDTGSGRDSNSGNESPLQSRKAASKAASTSGSVSVKSSHIKHKPPGLSIAQADDDDDDDDAHVPSKPLLPSPSAEYDDGSMPEPDSRSLRAMLRRDALVQAWVEELNKAMGPARIFAAGLTLGTFQGERERKQHFLVRDDGTLTGGFLQALVGTKLKVCSETAKGSKPSAGLLDTMSRVNPRLYPDRKERLALIQRILADSIKARDVRKEEDHKRAAEYGDTEEVAAIAKCMLIRLIDIQTAVKSLR